MATQKARKAASNDKLWADFKRESADEQARSEAMREFWEKEREERYRQNPSQLKNAMAQEEKVNAYLKSRGLKPYPSIIPKNLRRKAKRLLLAQRDDRIDPGRAKRR